jgi:diguanylate cyclase (GGDEF)-like protein
MGIGRLAAAGTRWPPVAFYLPAGAVVLAVLVGLARAAEDVPVERVAGPAIGLFDLTALVLAILVCRRGDLDPRTRRAWRWFAASRVMGLLSGAAFVAFPWEVFPSPGDVLRIGAGLIMLVSLLQLPRRAGGRLAAHKLALDVGAVVVAGAMVLWYLIVGPALAADNLATDAVAAAVAYPLGDLLVLFAVALVLLRGVDATVRLPLYVVAVAMLFEIAGNSYLGYLRTHPGWVDRSGWQMACYVVSHFGLAAAAFEQLRRASGAAALTGNDRPVSRMPYLGIGLSVALLIVAAAREDHLYPWAGLVLGTVAITVIGTLRQALALRENHELAITDPLTGLANRARLHDALGRALVRGHRSGQRVAVLLADLNGFKEVNDTLGHAAGDHLLREFSQMLRRAVLGGDVVGRLGGDEFAVVLHDIGSAENVAAVVRRLRSEMQLPIMVGDVVVRIDAAVGYALSDPGELDVDEVLRRADEEMYRVKRAGKAAAESGAAVDEDLAADLQKAASAGELRVHYQPIVRLLDGTVTGVEALLRWEHPTRGLLAPLTFIPLAEQTGAIVGIGAWVLEEACGQLASWRQDGHDLYLTVNLSPRQLEPGLAGRVSAVLDRVGLEARHLIIEVTESVEVGDPIAVEQLRQLRDLGIRIALDDFGTGYSTLRYLTMLPVDILKIDRSFVARLNGTPNGAMVVETLVRMGRRMSLGTVAEGVESLTQAAELADLGCDHAQGFHFAKPMPGVDVQVLLENGVERVP